MPSVVPFTANVWRITPTEFVGLISDAQRNLTSGANVDVDTPISVYWVTKSKQGREDHPTVAVEDVVSTIEIPRTHAYVGLRLTLGDRMIRITLVQRSVEIMLQSTDQDWLRLTEPWAREAIIRFVPKWAWLTTFRGWLAFTGLLFAANAVIYFGLIALGADWLPAVLTSAIGQVALLGAYIAFTGRSRVVLGERGPSRFRAVGIQGLLLVIGALLGVLGQRLFDTIFPPA